MPNGEEVIQITLKNSLGWQATIISLGAIIKNLEIPDREGKLADVILGKDTLEGYLDDSSASAVLIGRVANRIQGASFYLNDKVYQMERNENGNCLHSGSGNYGLYNFKVSGHGKNWVTLNLEEHNAGGFPGEASLNVRYTLTDDGALEIQYQFQADEDTPVSLTNHGYFNLSGGKEEDIRKHDMRLNTSFYTPVDDEMIPTGEILKCGSCLNFTLRRSLSEILNNGFGLDHNFVLSSGGFGLAGELWNESSGRKMEVYTDCPGIQIYTGNHFTGGTGGKNGVSYKKHAGICFETQQFPNAINTQHFPDCIVKKGTIFNSKTSYRFCTF